MDRLDHRTARKGSDTGSNVVDHIYGADIDWIVFCNQEGDLKTNFNAGYGIEERIAKYDIRLKALDVEYVQKCDKTHWDIKTDVFGTAAASALREPEKVDEALQTVRDFIDRQEKTIKVYSRGSNPSHTIYLTENLYLGCEVRDRAGYPENMRPSIDRLLALRHPIQILLPKAVRADTLGIVGNALAEVLHTGPKGDVNERIVSDAETNVQSIIQKYAAHVYRGLMFVALLILSTAAYGARLFVAENIELYLFGALGGAVGALIWSYRRVVSETIYGRSGRQVQRVVRCSARSAEEISRRH